MAAPASSTFHLKLRHEIWRVLLDGAFFGDYRSKRLAIAGVDDARRALEGSGRIVTVVVAPEEA